MRHGETADTVLLAVCILKLASRESTRHTMPQNIGNEDAVFENISVPQTLPLAEKCGRARGDLGPGGIALQIPHMIISRPASAPSLALAVRTVVRSSGPDSLRAICFPSRRRNAARPSTGWSVARKPTSNGPTPCRRRAPSSFPWEDPQAHGLSIKLIIPANLLQEGCR